MKKNVVFEKEELADLQTAVIRMLWTWQARKEADHPEADRYLERYQKLYVKISGARWGEEDQLRHPSIT
ncbi:MAG: hypothetical protein Kow0063_10980 [Anaerolineae bacterium]